MIKELSRTNRLTLLVLAIVMVIIAGLITLRRPDVNYSLTPAATLALMNDTACTITPARAKIEISKYPGMVLIDVRNSSDFKKKHLGNSINVPVRKLFTRQNKTLYREINKAGVPVIIYGETQQQASGPWLMLRQTGLLNAMLYTGSFTQLSGNDSLTWLFPQFSETPQIDTLALKNVTAPGNTGKAAKETDKKPVIPVKKQGSSGGGC